MRQDMRGYAGLRWKQGQPWEPGDTSLFLDDAATWYTRGNVHYSINPPSYLSKQTRSRNQEPHTVT